MYTCLYLSSIRRCIYILFNYITKKKRTKRQRSQSPILLSLTTSSSTENDHHLSFIQATSSTGYTDSTSTSKAGGFDFYKCKNCDRCFPSFQALGGHMTSHKKPKNMVDQEAKKFLVLSGNQSKSLPHNLQISNIGSSTGNTTKSKVHECSICGSEYSSGQALGGHMRRHRTTSIGSSISGTRKSGRCSRPPSR